MQALSRRPVAGCADGRLRVRWGSAAGSDVWRGAPARGARTERLRPRRPSAVRDQGSESGAVRPLAPCADYDIDDEGTWQLIGETEDQCIYELVDPAGYGIFDSGDRLVDPYS